MTSQPPLRRTPSEFRRALWLFVVPLVFVLSVGPSDLLYMQWWREQSSGNLQGLAAAASIGVALGILLSRDIWNLMVRNNPLWYDALLGAGVIAVFGVLVYLRESEIWRWSFAAADALVVSLLGSMSVVTLLTEQVKKVRVYAFARRFSFVHVQPDA